MYCTGCGGNDHESESCPNSHHWRDRRSCPTCGFNFEAGHRGGHRCEDILWNKMQEAAAVMQKVYGLWRDKRALQDELVPEIPVGPEGGLAFPATRQPCPRCGVLSHRECFPEKSEP